MRAATRDTYKGKYKKAIHAVEILKLLNVAQVRQASRYRYCDRFFKTLPRAWNIHLTILVQNEGISDDS